jgi:hypothetical protein
MLESSIDELAEQLGQQAASMRLPEWNAGREAGRGDALQ